PAGTRILEKNSALHPPWLPALLRLVRLARPGAPLTQIARQQEIRCYKTERGRVESDPAPFVFVPRPFFFSAPGAGAGKRPGAAPSRPCSGPARLPGGSAARRRPDARGRGGRGPARPAGAWAGRRW